MKLQVPINFISKLREKLPLSSQLISGHCPPHFIPPENTRKSEVSYEYIFRGCKIGPLARNRLSKQLS